MGFWPGQGWWVSRFWFGPPDDARTRIATIGLSVQQYSCFELLDIWKLTIDLIVDDL